MKAEFKLNRKTMEKNRQQIIEEWVKDDIEQAIKRGGQEYADAYSEGLYDAYNNPLPDLEALEGEKVATKGQTAVEWLEQIYLTSGIDRNVHFSQAKRMGADQMKQHVIGFVSYLFENNCRSSDPIGKLYEKYLNQK